MARCRHDYGLRVRGHIAVLQGGDVPAGHQMFTAMGSPVSVTVANLVMAGVEQGLSLPAQSDRPLEAVRG